MIRKGQPQEADLFVSGDVVILSLTFAGFGGGGQRLYYLHAMYVNINSLQEQFDSVPATIFLINYRPASLEFCSNLFKNFRGQVGVCLNSTFQIQFNLVIRQPKLAFTAPSSSIAGTATLACSGKVKSESSATKSGAFGEE